MGHSTAEPMFLIRGPAGVGKSTIAQTSAEAFTREDLVGAAFLCSDSCGLYSASQLVSMPSFGWFWCFPIDRVSWTPIHQLSAVYTLIMESLGFLDVSNSLVEYAFCDGM